LIVIAVQIIPEHEHIANLNAVFVVRRAVVPEVVLPNVIHTQASFLVEGDVLDAGISGANKESVFTTPPGFLDQPLINCRPSPCPCRSGAIASSISS
jgi:hypothetical protein